MKHSLRQRHRYWTWPLSPEVTSFCYISLLLLISLGCIVDSCFVDSSNHFGRTSPNGDIILHVGDPLELNCTIDIEKAKASNYTIDNLIFERDGQHIDPRYITRVNETTIRLYIENQTESNQMYYCYLVRNKSSDLYLPATSSSSSSVTSLEITTSAAKYDLLQRDLVCMNMVAVGREPREVENLKCIVYNWQAMNCSWVVPKNYIKTNYTIQFMPKSRYVRETSACPNDDDIKNGSCQWTLYTRPQYRKNIESFKIIVTGTNKFKSNEQSIIFQQFAHILPDGPKDMRMVNKTTKSIMLDWDIGDLQYFPKTWIYKILYKFNHTVDWFTFMCDPKDVIKVLDRRIACNVTDLMPNTMYNFRVYMKSSIASDNYWSKNFASLVLRTKASKPGRSPRTDVGSFQIEPSIPGKVSRVVYIYWESLAPAEYCGENFHYRITPFVVDKNDGSEHVTTDAKCITIESSFAKYEIGQSKYRFEIWSVNDEGSAPNASSIVVPAIEDVVEPCTSFSKTDYDNNLYEVSWLPPPKEPNIENFTIFWCKTERERPYQCNGFTQWIHIPPNSHKHNFSIETTDTYQFAISVNTRQSSSGMLWATCTVLHGYLGIVKQVSALHTGSTYINLTWKLECWDQGSTINGFVVTYCSVSALNDTKCISRENKDKWPGDAYQTKGTLTGLLPYTYYKVSISMYTVDREGAPSVPVVFQTSDGPPNVEGLLPRVIKRTNESATIGWEVPRQINGILHHYKVLWHQQLVESTKGDIETKTTQVTLTNLSPYTEYNVTVQACTSVCSKPMTSILLRTRIGQPDAPVIEDSPDLRGVDGGEVKWNPPARLAGPHPYYELLILKDNDQVLLKNVTNSTETQVTLPECTGDKDAGLYSLKVRAINVDDEVDAANEAATSAALSSPLIHVGPWSPVYAQNCNLGGLSTTWKVLACIFFPLFFAIVFFYGGRKSIYKCKQMKSVQVTIPMKFVMSTSSMQGDSRGHDTFENYSIVPPLRPADELSNLVERSTEQAV